jgi:hypothetical protein
MTLDRFVLVLTAAAAASASGRASAQADAEMPPVGNPPAESAPPAEPEARYPEPPKAPPRPSEIAPYPDRRSDVLGPPRVAPTWMPASGIGMTLFAGGGVTDFLEGSARSATRTGGSWTARLTVGTRSVVAFDGSYVGGENAIDGFAGGGATLMRNGLEGAVRVNAPLVARDTLLEPYALGGVGWNNYRITNAISPNASVSATSDSTLSVPLAAGFTVGYHGFMADLRFTFRPTYDQNILTGEAGSALSNWDLGVMLGYEL